MTQWYNGTLFVQEKDLLSNSFHVYRKENNITCNEYLNKEHKSTWKKLSMYLKRQLLINLFYQPLYKEIILQGPKTYNILFI